VTGQTAIELIIDPRERDVAGHAIRRTLPYRKRRMVGPFIFADLMGPEHVPAGVSVDVDAHPHLGMSTLTYLFAGGLLHRDSTGAVQEIEPGAVNWMTAGRGCCHTERTPPQMKGEEKEHFGLQTWVALPIEMERADPFFEHAKRAEIPEARIGDTTVRVAAGSGWGMASPVAGSSPLVEAEIMLDDGALTVPADHRERGVLNVAGDLTVADQSLAEGQLAVLAPGEVVELRGRGHAMVIGGDPVGDRWIWWNFVASDREIIEEAKVDWDRQRFPLVPGDHDIWVPRPLG
jgi:redox-sensitive bicupin YhaK (pirin superfamily)